MMEISETAIPVAHGTRGAELRICHALQHLQSPYTEVSRNSGAPTLRPKHRPQHSHIRLLTRQTRDKQIATAWPFRKFWIETHWRRLLTIKNSEKNLLQKEPELHYITPA
jgi:hypothetical protein